MVRPPNTGLTFIIPATSSDSYINREKMPPPLYSKTNNGNIFLVPSFLTQWLGQSLERPVDGMSECSSISYIGSHPEGGLFETIGESDERNNLLSSGVVYGKQNSKSRSGSVISVDQWKSTVAITHFLVLVLVVSLTTLFFSSYKESEGFKNEKLSILSETWVLATGKCDTWVDGSCIPSPANDPNKESLGGIMPEFEVLNNGLFSSVNALAFSFTASVIATAFSFVVVITDNASTKHMLDRIAKGILIIVGILLLFVQKEWKLPLNNILVMGGFIFFAFLAISLWPKTRHISQQSLSMCMLSNALTYPLIIVSVLSTVGEDNAVVLLGVFVSTFVAWLLMVMAYVETEFNKDVNTRLSQILILCFWTCFLPFIIACSIRIHDINIDDSIQYPMWSTIALGLMFGSYILDALWFTFHYAYYYNELPAISFGSMIVRVFDILVKYTLMILLVTGYFIELK